MFDILNKTLKLYNAVPESSDEGMVIDFDNGLIITGNASKYSNEIKAYFKENRLSGNDLNKTFHKSWNKILNTGRAELLAEQIAHYLSTYGSDFQDEVYIPDEALDIKDLKLSFKVIKGLPVSELQEKSLHMLESGIALQQETIEDILKILYDTDYKFVSLDRIKNKEACILITETFGVCPSDPVEALRYCVYKSTDSTLLIKNNETLIAIRASFFDPSDIFNEVGLGKMASIFNRFKPIFLAYKGKCKKVINKISKLSKTKHVPMVVNPLSVVTSRQLEVGDLHWLENATIFSIFKALNACYTRVNGQIDFVYRIRNGKSFTKTNGKANFSVYEQNISFITSYLKSKYSNLVDEVFYIPNYVKYTLPTSEKMFVGNIPTGTKFFGDKIAAGVYWRNEWGARDIDISGINLGGKVGWNSSYNQRNALLYSGDLTDAVDGAVEYLHCVNGDDIPPTLVKSNIYSGNEDAGYKIVLGLGDDVTQDYMMNPENVLVEIMCQSVQRQTYIGLMQSEYCTTSFTLLNFGAGSARVSGNSELSTIASKALVDQYNNQINLRQLLILLGAKVVDTEEEGCYNLSPEKLEKDTLINIFK